MTNSNDTTPPRSPLIAPIATGVLGLAAGAALVVVLVSDGDDGGAVASAPGETSEPAGSRGDVATTTTTASPATSAAPTTAAPTTVAGPLRDDAARIDGVTYIETAQCVTFPISNPDAGIGDAHINVSLHRVESTEGDRLIIERWSEDGFASLAISEPGGRYGRTEAGEGAVGGVGTSIGVPMGDGTTVEVEHTLVTGGRTCDATIVQGASEFFFDSLGAIDVCAASEASGLGRIITFQQGSMLTLADDADFTSASGELRVWDDQRMLTERPVQVETDTDESGLALVGTVTPGYTGEDAEATDTITVRYDGGLESGACLPEQEARFVTG